MLEELFNDIHLDFLRWLYESPELTEEKGPFEYVVPPQLYGSDQQTLNT